MLLLTILRNSRVPRFGRNEKSPQKSQESFGELGEVQIADPLHTRTETTVDTFILAHFVTPRLIQSNSLGESAESEDWEARRASIMIQM